MRRISSRVVYRGPVADVRIDKFRHPDGAVSERQVVVHPGAVGIVAHDAESIWLVRQPREVVGAEALLEVPAGKLDVEGESPLECARRELAEEVGKAAERWTELKRFYTSPGFAQEEVILYLATGLSEAEGFRPGPGERIEVVAWPLTGIDAAIAACKDAKSLIGLQLLRAML